jgi:hypothetical protein
METSSGHKILNCNYHDYILQNAALNLKSLIKLRHTKLVFCYGHIDSSNFLCAFFRVKYSSEHVLLQYITLQFNS